MALKGQPSQGDRGRVAAEGLSEAERRLLRKLTRPPDSRRTIGVVLSDEEMDCLRRLGGIETGPRRPAPTASPAPPPRRTRDLDISEEEKAMLRSVALGEAMATSPAPRPRGPRTTEIVLSPGEVEFLRRLSVAESSSSPPAAVRSKLRSGELSAGRGADVALELTPSEAQWLDRLTRERDTFITDAERRARVQLREKLQQAKSERRNRT